MYLPSVTLTEPAHEPITIAEAARQCRIDEAGENEDLEGFIKAARRHAEAFTGLRFITQTVAMRATCYADLAQLPLGPMQSITSIGYTDASGFATDVPAPSYEARLWGGYPGIALRTGYSWPAMQHGSALTVTAIVGFGDGPADVPEDIRHAVKLMTQHFYDREGGDPLDGAAGALLGFYRRMAL